MGRYRLTPVLAGAIVLTVPALRVMAAEPDQAQSTPVQPAQPLADGPQCATGSQAPAVIPALTPVLLVIKDPLGSAISTTGQAFAITLREPILIGTREVIPAGATGMGEVVWAKKAGGSGSAGELVLAARYLEVGTRHLRLRSLDLHPIADNRYKTVNSIAIATAATVPVASVIGFAIKGKDSVYAAGTVAAAKTAEPFDLTPPAAPTPSTVAREENACVHP